MNFPYKAILFDWAYTLVDLVSEDDRAAFLELMRFLKEKDVELPEFELIFSEYQDLFYKKIDVACGMFNPSNSDIAHGRLIHLM